MKGEFYMKIVLFDRDVRDHIGIRWFLQLYVANDVDVAFCTTQQQLSSKLQTFQPDVALINVDLLPTSERDTMYYVIKQSGCHIVAMTDEPLYAQALKAIALRAHALLQKPIDLERLKNLLLTLPKKDVAPASDSFYTALFLGDDTYDGTFFVIELQDDVGIAALYRWLSEAVMFQHLDVYALSTSIICISEQSVQKEQLQAIQAYWQKEQQPMNISVYDGEPCTMRAQYKAAKRMLEQRFYRGYGHILYTSQTLAVTSFDPLLSPQQQQHITDSLQQFQLEPLRQFLAQLQHELFEQEDVRVHLTSVLAQVRRFMLQYELQHERTLEQQYRQLFRSIIDCPVLYRIIADILRFTQHVVEHAKTPKQSFASEAKRYIAQHFNEQSLTLAAVANALHISPTYTSTLFTKQFGMTFVQYVQHIRLQHAMQLLKTTDVSIADIAEQCGFRDANYFSKLFKRKKGMTPTYYRKRMHD